MTHVPVRINPARPYNKAGKRVFKASREWANRLGQERKLQKPWQD